jgi:hypothetical protein
MPPIPSKYAWARQAQPTSSHATNLGGYLRYSFGQLFMGVLCLCFSAAGFFVPAKEGPVVAMSIGAVFLVLAAACFVWAAVRCSKLIAEVDVYPDGVLWLQGAEFRGARYDEIAEFHRAESTVNGMTQRKNVVIKTTGGEMAVFEHALSGWEELANELGTRMTLQLAPRALERFHAGETVAFGSVSIGPDGLTIDKELIPYSDMKDVHLQNGAVVVYTKSKKGGDCRAAFLGVMPNYLVFLKLLEESPAPPVKLVR